MGGSKERDTVGSSSSFVPWVRQKARTQGCTPPVSENSLEGRERGEGTGLNELEPTGPSAKLTKKCQEQVTQAL